ncbi:MAG: hypothetical protein Q7K57_02095 [Burkholderiaceae bacterium]|nr:hypothetical protein [Burkholderiaceae bacterium]
MTNKHDIHTVEQLKQLFPYQFSDPDATYDLYQGWIPIVVGLCMELDALLGDQQDQFHWKMMKEKFGSARLYYVLGGQNIVIVDMHELTGPQSYRVLPIEPTALFEQVDALVEAAENATENICMVCGAAAQTRSYNGYLQTLCDAHHPDVIGQDAVRTLAKARSPGLPRTPRGDAS